MDIANTSIIVFTSGMGHFPRAGKLTQKEVAILNYKLKDSNEYVDEAVTQLNHTLGNFYYHTSKDGFNI